MPSAPHHAPPLLAVVEDDAGLLADLVEFLQGRGFAAQGFEQAEDFFSVWPERAFDLLLLDVALPGMSGLEIARRVRAHHQGQSTGILMLTALDANADQLLGFNAGADIYLSKRSSLEVIEAACHGLLRRLSQQEQQAAIGPWRLLVRHWRLEAPNGAGLDLTNAEMLLLRALCEKPGQTVTRETLLASLKKQETLFSLRNLDNMASRLRRKVLASCGLELPLRSSYGQGYSFAAPCELEE